MPVAINPMAFASPNAQSPGRCTVLVNISPLSGDSDLTNDASTLLIDVLDKNDY
jgi:hypothetical protein